ncbi:class III signal peptide-containing protein [Methanobacterium spitsbergense]|uniref:Class III signal peptide-containing protein n=1 Tax=Methanobacterium spitsbergense TaxID=2874285 RepID=A0A8T5UW48_9EURY|nr:hypothetical protein [Methanobacterium spitsbergense]MBZ2165400.1 hypothetical protein [Methanobacterium spitsbergense]
MDQRAQISVEYILLVAIVMLIVIVFAVIITDQNEQNNVASAAQLGATNATANLIFTNTGQSPVKVTSVSMTNGTTINMTIHFSRSVTGQESVIIDSITKSLNSAGYTNTSKTTNSVTLTTSTGVSVRHTYFITLA